MMATTYSFVRGHFIDSETVFEMLITRCLIYIEQILIIVILTIKMKVFNRGVLLIIGWSTMIIFACGQIRPAKNKI